MYLQSLQYYYNFRLTCVTGVKSGHKLGLLGVKLDFWKYQEQVVEF